MNRGRNAAVLLIAALDFGVLLAVLKGQDSGVRDAIGNLSAPWVVLPFLVGMRFKSLRTAALAGLAATLIAFVGFYASEAAILNLGSHPWTTDLRLTLGSGHVYELWGVVSGSVYGALGGVFATQRRRTAALAVPLAFVCEPLIVFVVSQAHWWGGGGLFSYPWLWIAEIVVGLASAAFVFTHADR